MLTEPSRAARDVVLASALAGLTLSVASAFLFGLPEPAFHDEHAYLLAADTFVHGRLANPGLEHWQHFEDFHVLVTPTYASKFPPAQSLVLALGMVLGHPIVGVWLSAAALCAAVSWLVLGFYEPPWALFAGLLTAVHLCLLNYWSLGYWGGHVAAAGGALLFGATHRLVERQSLRSAVLVGLGLAVLANSRPLEGMLLALVCGAALALALLRRRGDERRRFLRTLVLGTCSILVPSAIFMAVYNQAVTGDPLRLPYQEYSDRYSSVPQFVWLDRGDLPKYSQAHHESFWTQVAERFDRLQTFPAQVAENRARGAEIWWFFLGWSLPLPFFAAFFHRHHRRWLGYVAVTLGLFFVVLWGYQGIQMHYLAPIWPLLVFCVVTGLDVLASLAPSGRRAASALALGSLVLAGDAAERFLRPDVMLQIQRTRFAEGLKSDVASTLEAHGGRHLVLIHLNEMGIHDEWITNGADPDSRTVLWAWHLGSESNQALIDDNPDRSVWLWILDPRGVQLHLLREAQSPETSQTAAPATVPETTPETTP